jgi:hypothetical protein
MKADQPKDIGKIFRDGTLIDKALKDAALESKRAHQRLGLPAVAWRDGEVVWVPADELEAKTGDGRSAGG